MTTVSGSIRALTDMTMTFFPEHVLHSRPDLTLSLQRLVEDFLMRSIPYEAVYHTIKGLVGITHPLKQLSAILGTGPTPIPFPDGPRPGCGRQKARPWTPYEDQRLLCGIYKFGIENWTVISRFVGNGRSRSQCSQRWYRGLDPTISKFPWSLTEEQTLLGLVSRLGDRSWTRIASKMGNRSDVQCRYKYKQLQKDRVGDTPPAPISGEHNTAKRERLPSVATLIDAGEWRTRRMTGIRLLV
jgi:hypothetical protein